MQMGTACTFANGSEVRLGIHAVPLAIDPTVPHYAEDLAIAFSPRSTTASFVDRVLVFQSNSVQPFVNEGTATVGACSAQFP
jgi:hypothetical protein